MRSRVRAAVPAIATVLAVALFVTAGNWQRGRMHGKEALEAAYREAAAAPPQAFPEWPAHGADDRWSALRYRVLHTRGRFDGTQQILIDNRVHDGRAGYAVVAPLLLPDGRALLVERGWVPVGASRKVVPAVPVPEGEVEVIGRVAIPSARYLELAPDARANRIWQHLDPARFRAVTGLDVLPVLLEQTAPLGPADAGLVRATRAPHFGTETHRMYMMQWYAFATLAVVLFIVLQGRAWRQRKAGT